MPNYRFDLPVNASRICLDDLIMDADTVGGYCDTNPWYKLLTDSTWQYQVVIKDLKEEDATYLIIKHKLTLVRIDSSQSGTIRRIYHD